MCELLSKKTIAVLLCIFALLASCQPAYAITEPCDATAEELADAIKEIAPEDERLSQYVEDYLNTECPIVLLSISAVESGWGRSALSEDGNLFGIKWKDKYVRFADKRGSNAEESIYFTEWILQTRFRRCETISAIGRTYSGRPTEWTDAVTNIHDRIWEILNNDS